MDFEDAHPAESRPPTLEDLLALCRSLNALGARYLVVGGFAVIQHGFTRATEDIDLLVESSNENQQRVKKALEVLPDKAVLELGDDDLANYLVVRVADEVVVDLMLAACGIRYEEASSEVDTVTIQGVPIPFASPALLLRMKQTHREKDALDRQFLTELLRRKVAP
jgi:Nucleotidyl transferase AbiEii toxin, Type IV TA system